MTIGQWKKTNGRIDMTGLRCGRLLVLGPALSQPDSDQRWRCQCDCGNEKDVRGASLRSGATVSCGCYSLEMAYANHERNRTHGHSATPTYRSWASMRKRCLDPTLQSYSSYGGRGISVCERWSDFGAFLADMGERPEGTTLDRVDYDGNYEPKNCRWATLKEQANNRRDNVLAWHNGRIMTAQEITDETGEPYHRVLRRIKRVANAQLIRELTQKALEGKRPDVV